LPKRHRSNRWSGWAEDLVADPLMSDANTCVVEYRYLMRTMSI